MDVWAVLSLIADTGLRLWNDAAAVVAPMPARFVVAGVLFFAAFVLIMAAFGSSRGTPREPKRTKARGRKRAADVSYANASNVTFAEATSEPTRLERTRVKPRRAMTADEAFSAHARAVPALPAPSAYSPWDRITDGAFQDHPRRETHRFDHTRDDAGGGQAVTLWQGHQAPSLTPMMPGSSREIIARLEARRGSRVIAIVHRENMERGYLDTPDLEDTLTAIRLTPKDKPLDIIIHSPGGHLRVGQQIARAIAAHPGKTTVFVPYFALGATTFMAFAADEIVMSAHAALSPVDPFAGAGPSSSVLKGIKDKPIAKVSDETVLFADIARKMLDEARRVTCELMHDGRDHAGVCRLADDLVSGKWSRDRAITATAAAQLGLNVSLAMPGEVYDLIRACRRGGSSETSVAFLDHARETRASSYRERGHGPVDLGVYDSNVAALTERARAAPRRVPAHTVWLAQTGGHVPDSAVERARTLIRRIEQERGSRVICIIHGENMENEGFDFDDLEDVLGAIVASEPNRPLDIVLHTQGGHSFTGRQIARAIKAHRARKTVFVPYYAMSAGSRISLAADQIVMGAQATLGPIDTQLYGWPAPSILHLLNVKPIEAISDEFLILAEEARKIMAEGRATACDLLQGTYSHDGSCAIADEMISGKWTHGFAITAENARSLGLNISTAMPDVFYDLVRCFRHADGEDPSVLFISR